MENKLTAQQLRIGNFVEYEGEIYEIDTISKLFPTLNTVAFGIGVVGWDNLNPIPLNEEWLLKFGFIKEYKWYYKNGLRLTLIGDLYFRGNFPIKADIKYVHSLQNLYFALTNEELAIK